MPKRVSWRCSIAGQPTRSSATTSKACQREPGRRHIGRHGNPPRLSIVAEARFGPAGVELVNRVLTEARVEIRARGPVEAAESVIGWRRFGKARHVVGLNLGDTFTYGAASALGWPVLCVGDDFRRTDLPTVP